MSRMLAVCLVLAMASVSFGSDFLLQSWEDGGGNIESWGPTVVGGQTYGVTDGAMSVVVSGPVQWQWIGKVLNTPTWQECLLHNTVSLDVAVKGEDWAGDNGFQIVMAFNSQAGWQQADLGAWYWGGDAADFTETVTFNYSAFLPAMAANPWVEVILGYNSYSHDASMTTTRIYFDNLKFTGVPEPATMALLGLGSLALLRRKK